MPRQSSGGFLEALSEGIGGSRAKDDILYAAKYNYGFTPADTHQADFLRAFRRENRLVMRSCHGFGKTAGLAIGVLDHMDQHHPAKVLTTAPTSRQIEDILWVEIRKWYNPNLHRDWTLLPTAPRIKSQHPDHFALGFSTDDLDKFEGWHSPNLLIVVDEAKGVSEDIFDAIQGALTEGGKLVYTSTPGAPSGTFFKSFSDPGFHHMHVNAFQAARVSMDWIEWMKNKYGADHPVYIRKVLGEFCKLSETPYYTQDEIDRAFNLYRQLEPMGPHTFGVDWGRIQSWTAIIEMVGPVGLPNITLTQQDYDKTVDAIVKRHKQFPFDFGCGDLGSGEGQIAELIKRGVPVVGRRMTNPYKLNYNSRLKLRMQAGAIALPPHHWRLKPDWSLREQLIAFEQSETASGLISLNAPGSGYDDLVDALVLCIDAQEQATMSTGMHIIRRPKEDKRGRKRRRDWIPR